MGLRTFGTSLATAAEPGSAGRDINENQIGKPSIPEKGAPGSLERQFVEEPIINQPPAGSEKILRAGPDAAATSLTNPNPTAPAVGEAAGGLLNESMGGRTMTPGGPNGSPSGANNQALFQGGGETPPSPASTPGRAGVTATSVSGAGPAPGAAPAAAYAPTQPAGDLGVFGPPSPTRVSNQGPNESVGSFLPGVASLGARAAAEGPGKQTIAQNAGQALAGTAANLISKVNPQAASGLRSFASNPAITNRGIGSISNPGATLGAVGNALRSGAGQVASNIGSAANNLRSKAGSFLGGLFGRR